MRIYRTKGQITDRYLTDGSTWRVDVFHTGGDGYDFHLHVKVPGKPWEAVYGTCGRLGGMGSGYREFGLYALAVGAAAYPGSDDDGNELPHPGKRFPGLLCALACAESDLLEKAAKR